MSKPAEGASGEGKGKHLRRCPQGIAIRTVRALPAWEQPQATQQEKKP